MADLFLIAEALGPKSANVIFYHGLGGDAYSTWSQHPKDKASFWPTWLARDIEGLSVYSVGYEAAASRWRGSAMHLIDRAPNVLASLLAERGLAAGPLILIGHSLGGLVIKQLLRTTESEARKREDAANFLRRVEKVAFLATPHTGADLAVWGDSLRIIVWPSAAAASLARNDPNLRDLNGWYRDWANQPKPGYPPVAHLILTETKPYGLLGMVVKPDSSDPGLANAQIVPTDCDHVAICKPKNDKSQIYRLVLSFILSPVERPKDPLPIIVEGQVRIEKNIDELPDDVAERVVALLDKREIAKAADAGLERATILELARPLRSGEVIDFDQAIVELRHAVSIALGVIAKGERGSNQEAFVEDVLKRLAETTKKGDFDSGAKAVDDALAEFDRREEEHRAASRRSRETLLEAGAEQDLLRRDPASVAQRIEAIAAMDSMDGNPAWSQKYRERWDAFYAEGDEKGINLSLEVAIEMARLMAASAREGDQRGTALDLLGNALRTLGERESGTARLEEAVAAYREALKENTREGAPLQWAVTQNNLGNALARLGERESGTARLDEAVAAYREALQERTRARVPLDWAFTQMNLALVYRALFDEDRQPRHLDDALESADGALEEFRKANAAFYIAKAERQREKILAAEGK
jgi:tetratricopeptide (TPR) repeat protein/pimeloyl-ACP methyl ester carboxylesterase